MIRFAIETDIARTPSDVFAYVTDPLTLANWQTNTVSAVPEGRLPLATGARLREVHRGPGGRELASLVEVVEYDPDRTFALRVIEGPLPLDSRITLEPIERGTHMRFGVRGQPSGAMRLAQPLLRFSLKRHFAADCERLKRILEDAHDPKPAVTSAP